MKNLKFLRSRNRHFCLLLIAIALVSCKNEDRLFELLPASKSGIRFQNTLSETEELNILDYLYFYNGGGVAMGDINNDGLPDLYFTSNQGSNKLYLNKGNLKFKDITETANVAGNSTWNTGVAMGDVNGDGWLDLYVLAVEGINGFEGHNELFINNKDNTFTEKSAAYRVDFKGYGTTAAFLDFDLDGDLDLYVLNHAVHTQDSFGRSILREERNDRTGDRLLRNDGIYFTDVSEAAGIYGGINGYGLGLSVSDFNKDGYPDIYVGNDFHEDDYYYLNNGDGTFTESLKLYFGHTSRFSMGNDVADLNHDGLPDLISLDMAPEDEIVLKSSEGDDTYQTLKMRTEQFGYHYQFTRNMLFTQNENGPFTETAIMSGVAATDWSWSALFGDYDQDGEQDLFVSNGIPKRPNDLDFIRFVSSGEIQKQINESRLVDQQALEKMPTGQVQNYVFKGDGSAGFSNQTAAWLPPELTVSGATAVGDLDGDGDLDIVTNNLNASAGIYVNTTNSKHTFLSIGFQYEEKNPFGIGTKVYAYHNGVLQFKELYPNRGWQASSEPMLHFGFGKAAEIDSLVVIWPNRRAQTLQQIKTNQKLIVTPKNTRVYSYSKPPTKTLFRRVENNLGITYRHKEDNHTDFDFQKLIPYEVSDRGPAFAAGDLNGDGKEDLFFGGARYQKAEIYIQGDRGFTKTSYPGIENDSIFEDVAASITSSTSSNKNILSVVSGGNTVSPSKKYLINRWYQDIGGEMERRDFGAFYYNSSVIKHPTPNIEGYNGLIGNHSHPLNFGKLPPLYLFRANGDEEVLEDFGMVTDAIWDDFDGDGLTDLIVVGEWMSPRFFRSNQGELTEVFPLETSYTGLWQTIIPFDIDGDGDKDYVLGNWGLNSKFKASKEAPMKMYYADFDENGTSETIIAIEKNGEYYPLLGLNELAEQLVFLRKKFPKYKDFAGKTIEEVLGAELISKATIFEVNTLTSGFLRNTKNTFNFVHLPMALQTAPLTAFETFDFDGDGKQSLLVGGNYFGVIPFHGRFDSFPGALINSEKDIQMGNRLGLAMANKSVRHIKVIEVDSVPYLILVYNDKAAEIYAIER